ncbi:MAG: NAD(P)-dependent glycerol-3-phosphate dehydrogenase [Candidatus Obscuribacterales bacterium]|nr:NAD(P)-dependent glycerol-3-phosphate dehydrogenase [Steroidobacteraceae bacterium]
MANASSDTSCKPAAPIAVLGAGSWGTALAIQFARTGRHTVLWGRNAPHLKQLTSDRCNSRYLPDALFPDALHIESKLASAIAATQDVLIAVPSHSLRALLLDIAPFLQTSMRIAWATKGFELQTGLLPHQIAAEVLGADLPMAVLSGPTFAREVGKGLPTAMTVAATDEAFARALAQSLSGNNFRVYTSADVLGVEVGGAVKNVLAIGAGMSDGLGYGANTRIALITRGLVEMTRLGVALGANRETFMGLAGLGDLVLTCTDNLSRNRRFGLAVAAGQTSVQAQADIGQVVEGVQAAQAVHEVATTLNVEMPICEQVYGVLYQNIAPAFAVKQLMSRELKAET